MTLLLADMTRKLSMTANLSTVSANFSSCIPCTGLSTINRGHAGQFRQWEWTATHLVSRSCQTRCRWPTQYWSSHSSHYSITSSIHYLVGNNYIINISSQLSPHPREVRYPEDSAAEDCHRLFPLWSRLRGLRYSGAGAEEGISRAAKGWRSNNNLELRADSE